MPIFDYRCDNCKRVSNDVYVEKHDEIVSCVECRVTMEKLPSLFKPSVFPDDGVTLNHLESSPKTFRSKQEMRDYEKKTGAYIDMIH